MYLLSFWAFDGHARTYGPMSWTKACQQADSIKARHPKATPITIANTYGDVVLTLQ